MIQQHHKGYARTFPHTTQADRSEDAQDDERGDKGRKRQRHFALNIGNGGRGGDDGGCGVVQEEERGASKCGGLCRNVQAAKELGEGGGVDGMYRHVRIGRSANGQRVGELFHDGSP